MTMGLILKKITSISTETISLKLTALRLFISLTLLLNKSVNAGTHSSTYNSTCEDGNLNIFIPSETSKNLLKFESGTCFKTSSDPANSTNYSFYYNEVSKIAILRINIEACGLSNDLYETPITTRSNSLYLATADVTLGILDENSGQELIFFEASLGAECGLKTTYQVTFDYGEIHSMNQTDCAEFGPDGVCILPSYTEYNFTFVEFEAGYETPVTDETRAMVAGQRIYLKLTALDLEADKKIGVQECHFLKDEVTFNLFDATEETDHCDNHHVGLNTEYVGKSSFLVDHLLFLLEVADYDSYSIVCTVRVCGTTNGTSSCNDWGSQCIDDSAKRESFLCDGMCADGSVCSVEDVESSGKLPVCRSAVAKMADGRMAEQMKTESEFFTTINEDFTIGIPTDSTTEIHTIPTELQQLDADFSGSAGGEGERFEDDDVLYGFARALVVENSTQNLEEENAWFEEVSDENIGFSEHVQASAEVFTTEAPTTEVFSTEYLSAEVSGTETLENETSEYEDPTTESPTSENLADELSRTEPSKTQILPLEIKTETPVENESPKPDLEKPDDDQSFDWLSMISFDEPQSEENPEKSHETMPYSNEEPTIQPETMTQKPETTQKSALDKTTEIPTSTITTSTITTSAITTSTMTTSPPTTTPDPCKCENGHCAASDPETCKLCTPGNLMMFGNCYKSHCFSFEIYIKGDTMCHRPKETVELQNRLRMSRNDANYLSFCGTDVFGYDEGSPEFLEIELDLTEKFETVYPQMKGFELIRVVCLGEGGGNRKRRDLDVKSEIEIDYKIIFKGVKGQNLTDYANLGGDYPYEVDMKIEFFGRFGIVNEKFFDGKNTEDEMTTVILTTTEIVTTSEPSIDFTSVEATDVPVFETTEYDFLSELENLVGKEKSVKKQTPNVSVVSKHEIKTEPEIHTQSQRDRFIARQKETRRAFRKNKNNLYKNSGAADHSPKTLKGQFDNLLPSVSTNLAYEKKVLDLIGMSSYEKEVFASSKSRRKLNELKSELRSFSGTHSELHELLNVKRHKFSYFMMSLYDTFWYGAED